ncbi:MAG: glmU [Polyangiaceae bacterium]|jgi:bifunctional UDP-N-acetylglucosamine pyrophosphorylase/glucosamine-1-phosphate N-acetyltransferase|nr:glmU [Polyangiaceae bacterium]
MSSLSAIVLAAGLGTRMKSPLPKVMHTVAGRPLLAYALRAAFDAGVEHAVVVTSGRPEIEEFLNEQFGGRVVTTVQDPPRGTGDAARIGLAHVRTERVLILCGDTPLLRAKELAELVAVLDRPSAGELSLMTCLLDSPDGYGRVVRDDAGRVCEVREQRDLRSDMERGIREVNAGMYAGRTATIGAALADVRPNNAQGEYYLTDIVASIARLSTVTPVQGHRDALLGVNDRAQLRDAEELMLERIRRRHAEAGVTVRGNPHIDDTVEIAPDATVDNGATLRGSTRVGAGSRVDVGCVLSGAVVSEGVILKPYTVITSSEVGDRAQLGPFSHLRPDSVIEAEAHLGNFVETKATRVRRGAKANHLAYLGDADIGEQANIGAGTIVCNYDGTSKHRTMIGAGAFVGSDSQLVAPVTVGRGAFVASGTTVVRDVPEDALAIGRPEQINKEGYAVKLREKLAARRASR